MNERIGDFDPDLVNVRCSDVGTLDLVQFKIERGGVVLNLGCGCERTRIDDDGLRALRDIINAKLDTGSFAALADTSAVPFVGKEMLCLCNGFPGTNLRTKCKVIAKSDDSDDWIVFALHSSHQVEPKALLPLVDPTPPKPVVSPYKNAVEAAHLIGKRIVGEANEVDVRFVGERSVIGKGVREVEIDYDELVHATCDGQPCGIVEPA